MHGFERREAVGKRVTRNIDLAEAQDLLEDPPRACLVVAGDDGPDAWPVTFWFDEGTYRVRLPKHVRPPRAGVEVVVLVDEGIHFFDLRAVYLRGRLQPGHDAWLTVEPEKVVAWDYGRMREVLR